MIYLSNNFNQNIDIIKTAIEQVDAIIIGAGSGLSNAAGLRYDDAFFNTAFPGYRKQYNLQTINEAAFYQFPTPEEQYACWVRLITAIHNYPAGKPYLDLYRIIKDKNYFILTTNTDGQFLKSGFPPEKICTPQGDYAYFQCSKPCNNEIYPNEQLIKKLLPCINGFTLPAEYIPHCPNCGEPLIPNIRTGNNFVEELWIKQYQTLHALIKQNRGKNILLLELGVGTNTPAIIRYPFEMLVLERKNTSLIRINLNADNLSLLANSDKAVIIQADIGPILAQLTEEY